jgi:Zn-dependent peptidase ImmA (M78 family)
MSLYVLTPIEDYIQRLYAELDIEYPEQLSMLDIASKLNVWIYFCDMESRAVERNGLYSMLIDRRLSTAEQWEDFGHELCHLLRHAGNQLNTHEQFIHYQEAQAEQFALHFCIPTFMLSRLPLPAEKENAVSYVAETFNVTGPFALQRLEKYHRRMQQAQVDQLIRERHQALYRVDKPKSWSPETKEILAQLQQQLKRKEKLKHKRGDQ